MKKRIKIIVVIRLFMASICVLTISTRLSTYNTLFNSMVEALSKSEFAGEMCYNCIEYVPSQWVLYCGNCNDITAGKPNIICPPPQTGYCK